MRNIVISGWRRGLGAALRTRFEQLGHRVHGFSRQDAAPNQVDVADAARVSEWCRQLVEQHGAPDLVIANAAVVTPPQPLWLTDPDATSRLLDVNVKGMFNLFRALVPPMLSARRGVLVGITSGYGREVTPRMSPYCVSKWAVEGLTRALASELPRGLACVAVDPGTLQTDMLKEALGAGAKFFPTPDLWVGAAADLLLSLGAEHNGQSLSVAPAGR